MGAPPPRRRRLRAALRAQAVRSWLLLAVLTLISSWQCCCRCLGLQQSLQLVLHSLDGRELAGLPIGAELPLAQCGLLCKIG